MAWYEVVVQGADGRPRCGRRVSLFGGGALTSGFSHEGFTDDDGRISLEHSARSVDVYVDGKKLRRDVGPGVVVVTT